MRTKSDECSGNVKSSVVRNDGKRESLLIMSLGIRNVFVKQLPNTPGPYVSETRKFSVVKEKKGG